MCSSDLALSFCWFGVSQLYLCHKLMICWCLCGFGRGLGVYRCCPVRCLWSVAVPLVAWASIDLVPFVCCWFLAVPLVAWSSIDLVPFVCRRSLWVPLVAWASIVLIPFACRGLSGYRSWLGRLSNLYRSRAVGLSGYRSWPGRLSILYRSRAVGLWLYRSCPVNQNHSTCISSYI